jgi:formylglycine-generating enzyme required for sulfatase activity
VTQVFLSYAGTDRESARNIAQELGASGVGVWWDQEGIGWGDNWIDKLQQSLGECDAYLILVGEQGVRRWVKAELLVALRRHFEEEMPIFPVLLPGVTAERLPPFLSVFQAASLDRTDVRELAGRLLSAAGEAAHPEIDEDVCPFPGLEAFEEDDARFFFGRQGETLDALRKFGPGLDGVYRRWLQVEGPSGVGKSSLVKAGLIPAIRQGWLDETPRRDGGRWRHVAILRPGTDPIENLAQALSLSLGATSAALQMGELYKTLRNGNDPKALRHILRQHVPEGGFLLVVDQLEEVFTLTRDEALRAGFDTLLAEALVDMDGPLHLVTTIRSDFMMRFAELPRLQALLNESAGRYFVPPIGLSGLRDVVRSPARLARLRWSEPTLPDRIVEAAVSEPAALPLVGYLLRLLWDRARKRGDRTLSAEDYRTLGGVGGALARDADGLLENLGREGKERARRLLLELVSPGLHSEDTRRTVTRAAALRAAGGDERAEEVLNRLSGQRDPNRPREAGAAPRLVVVSSPPSGAVDSDESLVDLAHEALLRRDREKRPYWETLRIWVDRARKELEARQLTELLAERWDKAGRPWRGEVLARSRQLRDFRRAGRAAEGAAAAYLRASRRLAYLRASGLGVVALLVVGMGAFGGFVYREGISVRASVAILLMRTGLAGPAVPEMVRIPGGRFTMGSVDGNSDEQPPHEVTIGTAFQMGKYEVTFDEYDVFVIVTHHRRPGDEGWRRGDRPVINVSWWDAVAYARWLSKQTGRHFRLPTEAEWEYAARAGSATKYWWGNAVGENRSNCYGCASRWDGKQTAPVGSFEPNPFGLYDVHGNVYEWVQDCYRYRYKDAPYTFSEDAPDDGSAWEPERPEDCGDRVLRGGSWNAGPDDVGSASRSSTSPIIRSSVVGFRLARDIE